MECAQVLINGQTFNNPTCQRWPAIHGRGQDPRQKELSTNTVLLIGSGSVGAPVGQQLAMAGVGHILPVDPATLQWANVGRHSLGADQVGAKKAIALAETWRKAYPHAKFEGFDATSHDFLADHPELVAKADLIILLLRLTGHAVTGKLQSPELENPHWRQGSERFRLPRASRWMRCSEKLKLQLNASGQVRNPC